MLSVCSLMIESGGLLRTDREFLIWIREGSDRVWPEGGSITPEITPGFWCFETKISGISFRW